MDQAVVDIFSTLLSLDDFCVAQNAQVVGDFGLGQIHQRFEVANTMLTLRQVLNQGEANCVR